MDDLYTLAAIAEIFGATAIVGGAIFGIIQVYEYRQRRRLQAAADLCRTFTEPALARSIVLLKSLPDGLSLEEFRDLDSSYEEAAQMAGMAFETMGLLVQKDIASLTIVQELAGGLLLMLWRKIEFQIKDTRAEQNNPRFGEWVQWLVERIEEREHEMQPAFVKYAESKRYRRR
jgi:hypothetical protein